MNRIAVSVLALAISTAAGSAMANHLDNNGYDNSNSAYANSSPRRDIAQVIRVDRIGGGYQNDSYQRQECWDEQTNAYQDGYYRDSNGRLYRRGGSGNATDSNTNGTLIGALIGGALGNQVGKGDGRKAATLGGAVAGGLIGNKMDRNHQAGGYDQYQDNSGTVRRCRTVTENDNGDGYDNGPSRYNVTYRYAGHTYHAVTRYNPGRTLRVVVDVRPQDENMANRR